MRSDAFSRQSFLGEYSQDIIEDMTVAIIGLGGGGSHIVQQLAHIGFLNYILYDSDTISDSNLNRLVGGTMEDVINARLKVDIASRVIKSIRPEANILGINKKWQDNPNLIRKANVIFGCVDSFSQRKELEICSRRYLIPYIDIGMDVHVIDGEPPRMAGQVILSMPGEPCMTCMGFLSEEKLGREAGRYGDVGIKPQVVWSNGILASSAVGIAIDILTNWTERRSQSFYLSYDGNIGTLNMHPKFQYMKLNKCGHYPPNEVGDPVYKTL